MFIFMRLRQPQLMSRMPIVTSSLVLEISRLVRPIRTRANQFRHPQTGVDMQTFNYENAAKFLPP